MNAGAINLEIVAAYAVRMDDLSDQTPRHWVEALDRSAAQRATDQTVPLEPVLDRLRASIARM